MWETSPRGDALAAAECIRITFVNKPFSAGGYAEATVTMTGRTVLRVLRTFVAARRDPFDPPGHEDLPGSCSQDEARAKLAAAPQLVAFLLGAVAGAPPRTRRTQYDSVKHALVEERLFTPSPKQQAALHIFHCDPAKLAEVEAAGEAAKIGATLTRVASDDPNAASIQIRGAHDVLRWLADDVDAWWA